MARSPSQRGGHGTACDGSSAGARLVKVAWARLVGSDRSPKEARD